MSARTSQYIPTPASFMNPWNAVNFTQPEYNTRSAPTHHHSVPSRYPESSHRHVATPPSSLLDAISVYTPPFTRPASRATASDAYSTPYGDANITSPESSASPPPPVPVKEEQPDDDGFIIDLPSAPFPQSLAPPTEVPLRATQASAPMRRMMGVFRLNPFAMHAHGGRGVPEPWAGGVARPLDEEPRIFEFQLELAEEMVPKVEDGFDTTGLRAFSPDFELDTEQDSRRNEVEANWELFPALSAFNPVSAYPRALHGYHLDPHFQPVPRRWALQHEPAFLM
ncbi:hypothetical protein C8R44DRAFT_937843 [Mycena epipterygia]|nr:hypothetical protein C8R44DRAFT_937843 [Mycena epipterygia]